MNKLITRQIEPRIEKYNKVLLLLSLLLLLNNIINFPVIYIFYIVFIGYLILGIYELYVYNSNEEFISLLKEDGYKISYQLIMKYYKSGLIIFICLLPGNLSLFNRGYTSFEWIPYTLTFSSIFIYYGLIDLFIIREKLLKIIIKLTIALLAFYLLSSGVYYFGFPYYLNVIYNKILGIQIIYLCINFNLIYVLKGKINKLTYINLDLVISITLILIYELLSYNIFMITNNLFYLPVIQHFIFYLVFLWVLLSLNRSLKNKFNVKKTKYSKIIKVYVLILLFIIPLMYLLIVPLNNFLNYYLNNYPSIKEIFKMRGVFIIITIIYIIAIEIVNIIFLKYYYLQKGIFKKDILELVNDLYNKWI